MDLTAELAAKITRQLSDDETTLVEFESVPALKKWVRQGLRDGDWDDDILKLVARHIDKAEVARLVAVAFEGVVPLPWP